MYTAYQYMDTKYRDDTVTYNRKTGEQSEQFRWYIVCPMMEVCTEVVPDLFLTR